MVRKIVQIAVTQVDNTLVMPHLVSLCDDGTVWQRNSYTKGTWEQLPPIPQPEPPEY